MFGRTVRSSPGSDSSAKLLRRRAFPFLSIKAVNVTCWVPISRIKVMKIHRVTSNVHIYVATCEQDNRDTKNDVTGYRYIYIHVLYMSGQDILKHKVMFAATLGIIMHVKMTCKTLQGNRKNNGLMEIFLSLRQRLFVAYCPGISTKFQPMLPG